MWFIIIVIGLMVRTDTLGVTSIMRALSLAAPSYPLLLNFFRSESFELYEIELKWQTIISKLPFLYRVRNMVVMVGDGVKQFKEGRYMPGVKKLHQESENSAKAEYIFGHLFGGIGVLVGNTQEKLYCVLLSLRLHEGLKAIRNWWKGDTNGSAETHINEETHVVKTIKDAGRASRVFGSVLLLLDRLYLTVPMLKTLALFPQISVVTKAKKNASAFYHPKPRKGPGAKAKKGEKIKVISLFETMADSFQKTTAMMYGTVKEISYYSEDFLWGEKLYKNLRFVLVWLDGVKTILVSTDLALTPVEIIELYCHRFKIECSFRELKQVIAGFSYRFWSKHMPKLNRFKPNDYIQEMLEAITDESKRACIAGTVKAIECFTLLSCISLGLLQIISILFSDTITGAGIRYMRTPSKGIPSEATVADFMRKTIYQLFGFFPNLPITGIIKNRQSVPDVCDEGRLDTLSA